MESWGIWKLIKVGFWLGIGFIIPQLVVLYSGTVITMLAMPSIIESSYVETEEEGVDQEAFVSNYSSNYDRTDQIEILDYREQLQGDQLLILGKITNSGDSHANSIQLEAELLDSAGEFVYECSEYINKKLQPKEIENFQIKCGCGKKPLPEYASITVRVVNAHSF